MFEVYILYSDNFDSFYIGYSSDLSRRINEHNSGETKSTKGKIPWRIVYREKYDTKLNAIRRERFLKAQKNKYFYKKLCGF